MVGSILMMCTLLVHVLVPLLHVHGVPLPTLCVYPHPLWLYCGHWGSRSKVHMCSRILIVRDLVTHVIVDVPLLYSYIVHTLDLWNFVYFVHRLKLRMCSTLLIVILVLRQLHLHVWQSHVEICDSVAFFNRIAVFEMSYCWTSVFF